jgi:hypothetical protein
MHVSAHRLSGSALGRCGGTSKLDSAIEELGAHSAHLDHPNVNKLHVSVTASNAWTGRMRCLMEGLPYSY